MKALWWKIALVALALGVAVFMVGRTIQGVVNVLSNDDGPVAWFPGKLIDAGFQEVKNKKPDGDPGEKIQIAEDAGGSPVFGGTGDVVIGSDTLEVEVVGVEGPDGSKWIGAWVNGQKVHFKDPWWNEDKPSPSPYDALVQMAWVDDQVDVGLGISRTIVEEVPLIRAQVALYATADLNHDITQPPDWLSAGARLSWQYGPVSFGLDGGRRVMQDPDWHTGVSLGLDIGNLEDLF